MTKDTSRNTKRKELIMEAKRTSITHHITAKNPIQEANTRTIPQSKEILRMSFMRG